MKRPAMMLLMLTGFLVVPLMLILAMLIFL